MYLGGDVIMDKDVKNLTRDLLGAAKAKGFDTAQIDGIMYSAEGKAIMDQLSGPGGEAMKAAAAKAAEGDTAALSSLLGSLMATPEGRSLASQAMKMKKNG
jgi:hypothetical protein